MKLFAITDLCERWNYSRVGIYKLTKRSDFPKPMTAVCRGRIKLFSEEAIAIYEQDKPWLFDETQKRQRQRLYAIFQSLKHEPDPQISLNKIFGKDAHAWKNSKSD